MPTTNRKRSLPFPHLEHACLMVGRNRRAYLKLSVTVILSFTLLLGYMAITDAKLYNLYAKVFSLPKEVVQCYVQDEPDVMRAFEKQIRTNDPNAQFYEYFSSNTMLTAYDASLHAQCFFIPDGVERLYSIDSVSTIDTNTAGLSACAEPIELIGEKQDFYLQKGEAIINEGFYKSLQSGGSEGTIILPVTFYWADGSHSLWELKVVGVCKDDNSVFITNETDSKMADGYVKIYLSQTQLTEAGTGEFESLQQIAFVSSDRPEAVMSYGRALGMTVQGVAQVQAEARLAMRTAIESKALTAAVMLILLAINLYSSFSNVLETRNFEIGVKRALGASRGAIIRQFLYEALLVLGIDSLLSIALVADGLIIYKFIQKSTSGITWIAYVSPYSIAIYTFCSLGLAVAFSLLFAYKATQVEIVKHLKTE